MKKQLQNSLKNSKKKKSTLPTKTSRKEFETIDALKKSNVSQNIIYFLKKSEGCFSVKK